MPKVPAGPSAFELRANALVGRLVMLYSRLDVNVALYVARWRGQEHHAKTLQDLENTSFKSKLDLVLPAVRREYGNDPVCQAEWQDWLASADKLRCKRNDLMHGRWGIYETQALVSNITGLPGSPGQREITYTLDELDEEVQCALRVASRFLELSTKWPA